MTEYRIHPSKCAAMFVANRLLLEFMKCLDSSRGLPIFVKPEWEKAKQDFETIGLQLYGKDLDKKPQFNPLEVKMAFQLATAALSLSDAACAAALKNDTHEDVNYLRYMQNIAATTLIDFLPGFKLPKDVVPDEFWARAKEIRKTMLSLVGWQPDLTSDHNQG